MLNYWRNQAHLGSSAQIWFTFTLACCPINIKKKTKRLTGLRKHVWMGSLPDKNEEINIGFQMAFFWICVSALNAIKLLLNFYLFIYLYTIWICQFVTISESQLFCGFCQLRNIYLEILRPYLRNGSVWFSACWCWFLMLEKLREVICVYVRACMRHSGCGVSMDPINWPNMETTVTSQRESVSILTTARRANVRRAHLQVKHVWTLLGLVWPNSKRSSVRVDKFTACAPCLESERREKWRDETSPASLADTPRGEHPSTDTAQP